MIDIQLGQLLFLYVHLVLPLSRFQSQHHVLPLCVAQLRGGNVEGVCVEVSDHPEPVMMGREKGKGGREGRREGGRKGGEGREEGREGGGKGRGKGREGRGGEGRKEEKGERKKKGGEERREAEV